MTRLVNSQSCIPVNTLTKGFEQLTQDKDVLLVRINNRKSNCDQTGGLYQFDVNSGVIGQDEVQFDQNNFVDWTQLKSQNNVTYNQVTNEVIINSKTLTLPQTPYEWEQFWSPSQNLFYVVIRDGPRADSNTNAFVYARNITDISTSSWMSITINDVTNNFLVNEEFLSNATWTATLDAFAGASLIDKYGIVTFGGYYRYDGMDTFKWISEFCCAKIDERSDRLYLSNDFGFDIWTFSNDGIGDIISNVTYNYTQTELERDGSSRYEFVKSSFIVFSTLVCFCMFT